MIRLNDERYWLYAAVDPETNELLHTMLEPTTTKVLAQSFCHGLRERHGVDDAVFLINGTTPLKDACNRHGLRFQYENTENWNGVKRVCR